MLAEISLSQIYWDPNVGKFFFREQSYKELEKLVNDSLDPESLFECIENCFESLDDFEEYLYDNEDSEIKEYLGIEYFAELEESEE